MPLLEWLEQVRAARGGRLADADYARAVAAEFVTGWSRPAPPPRWCSAPTSRRRSTRCSPRRRGSGCGSPAGSWSATGCCPTTLLTTPERALRRGASPSPGAGTASAATGTPSPRGSPSPPATSCSTPAPSVLKDVAGRLVHLARQREPRRGRRRWPSCSPSCSDYVDTYDRHGLVGRRACSPTTCTRPTTSSRVLADARRRGRALPDQQLGARQRAVPAAPPRRARRAGRARLRRRRRHRLLAVQGGAAGLLHAAAARHRRATRSPPPTCSTWRPAPARSRSGSATRSATSASASSSTRSGCARSAGDPLDVGLRHAASAEDALAKVFALGGDADLAGVWVGGDRVKVARD